MGDCTWECQLKHLFSHAIRENVRKILKVSSANPSWLLDKATFVKMGDIMSRNKGRILGLYDELSSFLTQVNIYRGYLSLYNGKSWSRVKVYLVTGGRITFEDHYRIDQ